MNSKELKQLVFNRKIDKHKLFTTLKGISRLETFHKIIKPSLTHPITKFYLFSNPLPKVYSDLRKNKFLQSTNNLEGEIAWNLYAISEFADYINSFISFQERFENSFLLNNFEDAESILTQIENSICKSIWLIESKFLLNETFKGSEANWNMLSLLSNEVKDPLTLFLIEYYSKRVESKITYQRFNDTLENTLNSLKSKPIKDYINLKLDFPACASLQDFPFFLTLESISSIIDRYLLLMDVISYTLIHTDINEIPTYIADTLYILNEKIEDKRITQMLTFIDPNNFCLFDLTADYLNVLNLYITGDYDSSYEVSSNLITRHPELIDLYEINIQSQIELGLDSCQSVGLPFVDKILTHLFNIFKRNNLFNTSLMELLKISVSSFGNKWGRQLYSLLERKTSIDDNKNSLLMLFNSKVNSVHIMNYFEHNAPNYLKVREFYCKNFGENNVIEINDLVKSKKIEKLLEIKDVPLIKRQLYICQSLYNSQQHVKLSEYCENLLNDPHILIDTKLEIIGYLFNSYVSTNEIQKAISFVVDCYLENENLIITLNIQKLVDLFEEEVVVIDDKSIDIPIFFRLLSVEAYDQYVSYDTFMSANNFNKPSDLLENSDYFDNQKLIFFLKNVCSTQVLHFSLYFNDKDEIESERLKIMQRLLILDPKNEQQYIHEIAELTKNRNIRDAKQVFNKGRITVNIPQLKSIEEINIKENFSRFQQILSYTENNKNATTIDFSTKSIEEVVKIFLLDKESLNDEYKADPAFVSFKNMFIDLRDKYLFSKECGLDGYLSTRIRHGTLENHIRSIFEKHHLISEKDISGAYLDIEYWNQRGHGLPCTIKECVQQCLKKFSNDIDNYIVYVIKEKIQVYTEKYNTKKSALFNYNFTEDFYNLSYSIARDQVNTHEEFSNFIFNELEDITKQHLVEIQEFFTSKLNNQFEDRLEEFREDINKILGDSLFIDLMSSINFCKTDIQNELRNISEWFSLSNPTTDLILDIDTILNTSVAITNSIYPNNQIEPVFNSKLDFPVHGGVNVIYICRILLDNIIKHSGYFGSDLHVEIQTELIRKELIRIRFKNNISEKIDTKDLITQLTKIRDDWSEQKKLGRVNFEGGSGFDKIRRILEFDMKCKNYAFNFELLDNNICIILDIGLEFKEI